MQDGYDVMQVCLNGHVITASAREMPEFRKPYCPSCGEKTIMACPECHASIPGMFHIAGVIMSDPELVAPNNCGQCGIAYPWRQAAIASAIEVLELGLEGEDITALAGLVRDVAVEGPRTEIAALRLKILLPKLGKATYDIAIKVISDLASETAKKTLGLKV